MESLVKKFGPSKSLQRPEQPRDTSYNSALQNSNIDLNEVKTNQSEEH